MPVGKKIKNSAEHARYVFGFLGSSPSNTDRIDAAFNLRDYTTCRSFSSDKNLKTTSSDCARAGEIPVGPDRSVDQLTQQLALAQEEIEKLRANLLSTKPPPEPNNLLLNQQKRAGYISEMSSSIAQPAACMIDYSALQDMVKCSICQLTLLDAVVCRLEGSVAVFLTSLTCYSGALMGSVERALRPTHAAKAAVVQSAATARDSPPHPQARRAIIRHTNLWSSSL